VLHDFKRGIQQSTQHNKTLGGLLSCCFCMLLNTWSLLISGGFYFANQRQMLIWMLI